MKTLTNSDITFIAAYLNGIEDVAEELESYDPSNVYKLGQKLRRLVDSIGEVIDV